MKFAHGAARVRPSLYKLSDPPAEQANDGPSNSVDDNPAFDRPIGSILRSANKLSVDEVDQVLNYQQYRHVPFGEAAIQLKLATRDDVLWALSQQFQYSYSPGLTSSLSPELSVARNPFGEQADAFRELRSQLLMGLLASDQPRRALAIVSPEQGDGKTFIAANLAVAFSQLGGHTLLIDADMRTPRLHQLLGVDGDSGLSNILSGRSDPSGIRPVPDLPSLFVLPAGVVPPNPLELAQRSAFGMLIHELLTRFDHVIVDTPATSHGSDARVIAARCGAALAVGRQGHSRMAGMQRLLASVTASRAAVAGVIINQR